MAMGFDYGALDDETRTIVESCRDEIRRREKRAAEDIIEIGRQLSKAREAIPSDTLFGQWRDAEIGYSAQTARRFMSVFGAFGESPQQIVAVGKSALYALADPSTPLEIRSEFVAKIGAGESVRYRDVRDRLAIERPAAEPPPLLSVVDLETGEVIATAEEYLEQERQRPSPSLADIPASAMPQMREKSREEMAFDRLAAMTIITDLDPVSVADAAADFRADTARLLLRRMPALEAWAGAFASRLRDRLETPLRAVR